MSNPNENENDMNNKPKKTPNWRNLGIRGPAGALGVNELPENPYNTPEIVQGYNPTGTSTFKNPRYGVFSGSQSLGGRANTEENYEGNNDGITRKSDLSSEHRNIIKRVWLVAKDLTKESNFKGILDRYNDILELPSQRFGEGKRMNNFKKSISNRTLKRVFIPTLERIPRSLWSPSEKWAQFTWGDALKYNLQKRELNPLKKVHRFNNANDDLDEIIDCPVKVNDNNDNNNDNNNRKPRVETKRYTRRRCIKVGQTPEMIENFQIMAYNELIGLLLVLMEKAHDKFAQNTILSKTGSILRRLNPFRSDINGVIRLDNLTEQYVLDILGIGIDKRFKEIIVQDHLPSAFFAFVAISFLTIITFLTAFGIGNAEAECGPGYDMVPYESSFGVPGRDPFQTIGPIQRGGTRQTGGKGFRGSGLGSGWGSISGSWWGGSGTSSYSGSSSSLPAVGSPVCMKTENTILGATVANPTTGEIVSVRKYFDPHWVSGLDPSIVADHLPELAPFVNDLLAIKASMGVITPIILSYKIYRIYKSSERTYLFKDIFKDIIEKLFDSNNNLDFEDEDVHEKVYFFTSLSKREKELILMLGRWYKDGKELSDKTILRFIKLMMEARLERLERLLVGRDLRELAPSENLEAGKSAMKSRGNRTRKSATVHFPNRKNNGYLGPSNIANIPPMPTSRRTPNRSRTRTLRPNITPYTPANMDPNTARAAATAASTAAATAAATAASTAAANARASATAARTAATVPT